MRMHQDLQKTVVQGLVNIDDFAQLIEFSTFFFKS